MRVVLVRKLRNSDNSRKSKPLDGGNPLAAPSLFIAYSTLDVTVSFSPYPKNKGTSAKRFMISRDCFTNVKSSNLIGQKPQKAAQKPQIVAGRRQAP